MLRFISLTLILLARSAASTTILASQTTLLRHKHAGKSFISSLEFKYTMRICNAYPYMHAMDVYLGKSKITDKAVAYKTCEEFRPNVKVGDKLDFKVGDTTAGSFTVSELPSNDAIMALIIFRHDTQSTAVSFESHVFSNLINAQVAVLDTFRGNAQSVPRIQDVKEHRDKNDVQRSEELRYRSVVAVNQGMYEVILQDAAGETKARHELVALNHESYLVVRCGVESTQGQAFPQELMIFPRSDPTALGGARQVSMFAAALATLFGVAASL